MPVADDILREFLLGSYPKLVYNCRSVPRCSFAPYSNEHVDSTKATYCLITEGIRRHNRVRNALLAYIAGRMPLVMTHVIYVPDSGAMRTGVDHTALLDRIASYQSRGWRVALTSSSSIVDLLGEFPRHRIVVNCNDCATMSGIWKQESDILTALTAHGGKIILVGDLPDTSLPGSIVSYIDNISLSMQSQRPFEMQ